MCSSTSIDAVSFQDIPRSISSRHKHVGVMASVAPAHRARRLACPWRGSHGVGRHGVGRGRPQRAIYCAIVAKENWRTATQGWGAGPSSPHPVHPESARARTEVRTGEGEEGGCGWQSGMSMSGERQAVCARRVDVRRPKGVGWGVVEPHEVGTDTRNDDRKIDC